MPIDKIYAKKVYDSLRDDVEGFDKDEATFYKLIETDKNYLKNVHLTLKDVYGDDFNKDESTFESALGLKKKEPSTTTPSTGYKSALSGIKGTSTPPTESGIKKSQGVSQSPLKTAGTTTQLDFTRPQPRISTEEQQASDIAATKGYVGVETEGTQLDVILANQKVQNLPLEQQMTSKEMTEQLDLLMPSTQGVESNQAFDAIFKKEGRENELAGVDETEFKKFLSATGVSDKYNNARMEYDMSDKERYSVIQNFNQSIAGKSVQDLNIVKARLNSNPAYQEYEALKEQAQVVQEQWGSMGIDEQSAQFKSPEEIAQYNELIAQYNGLNQQADAIAEESGITKDLQDLESFGSDYGSSLLRSRLLVEKFPNILKEKELQDKADAEYEDRRARFKKGDLTVLPTSLLNVGASGLNALNRNFYNSLASLIDNFGKLNDNTYSLGDWASKGLTELADNAIITPRKEFSKSGYNIDGYIVTKDKSGAISVFDKDYTPVQVDPNLAKKFNEEYDKKESTGAEKETMYDFFSLAPQLAEQFVTMYSLVGGGRLAQVGLQSLTTRAISQNTGMTAASYLMTYEDYKKTGIENGLSDTDAHLFASISAMTTSLLEGISPNENLIPKGQVAKALEAFTASVGAPIKTRMKAVANALAVEPTKEIIQEITQLGGDILTETGANAALGKDVFDAATDMDEIRNTAVLTFGTTALAQLPTSGMFDTKNKKEWWQWASKDVDKLIAQTQEDVKNGLYSEEKAQIIVEKAKAWAATQGKIPADTEDVKRAQITPLLLEKIELLATSKDLDKVFQAKINKRIDAIDKEIVSIMNKPLSEFTTEIETTTEETDGEGTIEGAISAGANVAKEGLGVATEPSGEGVTGEGVQAEEVLENEKPTPTKLNVLGESVNMYNNYIPSRIEDVEADAMYSFSSDSKDGIPSLLQDKAYANSITVNGVKKENWNASISGDELLKLFPKKETKAATQALVKEVTAPAIEVTPTTEAAQTTKPIEEQIADLRVEEQAEYDAMSDPNDKAGREKIYGKYDKLITPLLEEQKAAEVGVGGNVEATVKAIEAYPELKTTQVVDKQGKPLIVYHGTDNKNITFKDGDAFFSGNKEYASGYGKNLVKAYLDIKKLFTITEDEANAGVNPTPEGYDGWAIKYDDGTMDYRIRSASQIKIVEEAKPSAKVEPVKEAAEVEVIEEEQYEPITVGDTSHDSFTRDNAVDYEEDEKEGDNGRTYTYLSSVTVELVDDVSGETIGRMSKLKSEDGEITYSAEDIDGNQVAEEVSTKAEAQRAIVDQWNKQQEKEFKKEKAKEAKEKAKEAAAAKKKAEKEAEKAAAKAAKEAAKTESKKSKPEQIGEGLLDALGLAPVEPAPPAKKAGKTKPVNVSNKSELAELEDQADGDKKTIIEAAKKAIATLRSVFPDMEIYIHEDPDSYNEQMGEVGGVANSRGNFAFERDANDNPTGKGRIDINLSNAKDTTVAHELVHAVLLKAFGDNPAVFKAFRDRMSTILRADLNEQVTAFEKLYAGQDVAPEEYLTELAALLSQSGETVEYKPSTLRKVAALINEFVSRITKGKFQPFRSEVDFINFVDFLNQISGAISEGGEIDAITEKINTSAKPTGIKVDTSSLKSKASLIQDLGLERFNDMGKRITQGVTIKDLGDVESHLTFSDRLVTGKVGKKDFLGGILFAAATNRVWASFTKTRVSQIISGMPKNKDGYRYLMPALLTEAAHMSNKDMSNTAIKLVEDAIAKGEISPLEADARIRKALGRKGLEKFLELYSDTIGKNKITPEILISAIDNGLVKSTTTFDDRNTFLESLLGKADIDLKKRFGTLPSYSVLANGLAEPITNGHDFGDILLVIRTKGDLIAVQPKEGDADYHPSYPWVIRSVNADGSIAEVETLIFKESYNAVDVFPAVTNKQGQKFTYQQYVDKYGNGAKSRYLGYMGARSAMSTSVTEKIVSEAKPKANIISKAQVVYDETGFISVPSMIEIVKSNNPTYLVGVMEHIQDMGEKLKTGKVDSKDVAKSYLMAVSSIRSGDIGVDKFEKSSGKKIDEVFLEPNNKIRTEGAMAFLLTTDEGKRLLKNIESGKIDEKDRNFISTSMKPFGMFGVGESKYENIFGKPSEKQINLTNINEFNSLLKGGVKNESELFDAIVKLKGISQAKVGFVSNFLGIGTRGVIDAREIQGWLRGSVFQGKRTEQEAEIEKELTKSNKSLSVLQQEILKRMRLVGEAFGVNPLLAEYIGHHMIWDAVAKEKTTHDGLYLAMTQNENDFNNKLNKIKSKSQKSQDDRIKEFIDAQRKEGQSDKDIKAGLELVADKVGLTPEDINNLMGVESDEAKPLKGFKPKEKPAKEPEGEKTGTRAFAAKSVERAGVPIEDIPASLSSYEPTTVEEQQKIAEAFIRKHGIDNTITQLRLKDSGIDPKSKPVLASVLLKELYAEQGNTKDVAEIEKIAIDVHNVLDAVLTAATEAAQFMAMMREFYNSNPYNYVAQVTRLIEKNINNPIKANVRTAVVDINKANKAAAGKTASNVVKEIVTPKVTSAKANFERSKANLKAIWNKSLNIGIAANQYEAAKNDVQFAKALTIMAKDFVVYQSVQFSEFLKEVASQIGLQESDIDQDHLRKIFEKAKSEKIQAGIKVGLKELELKLKDLIESHYSATEIKGKLIDKLKSEFGVGSDFGLNDAAIKELEDAIKREIKVLTAKEKIKALKALGIKEQKDVNEILSLSEEGLLDDNSILETLGDKLGIKKLTPEEAAKLADLAKDIKESKEDRIKARNIQKFEDYKFVLAKKYKIQDFLISNYLTNIFGSLTSNEKNIAGNVSETILLVGELMGNALASGNPKDIQRALKALVEGNIRGFDFTKEVLTTGVASYKEPGDIRARNMWELIMDRENDLTRVERNLQMLFKIPYLGPIALAERRFWNRALLSMDSLSGTTNNELGSLLAATREADKQNLRGAKRTKFIEEQMANSAEAQEEARNYAISAGYKEGTGEFNRAVANYLVSKRPEAIKKAAAEYSARATLTQRPPESTMTGAIANGLNDVIAKNPNIKFFVPVVNTFANLIVKNIERSPFEIFSLAFDAGRVLAKVESAKAGLTKAEVARRMKTAAVWTAISVLLFALAGGTDDDEEGFEVFGSGTGDPAVDNARRALGWKPNTVRFSKDGGYYNFEFLPFGFVLGMIGNMRDYFKYKNKPAFAIRQAQAKKIFGKNLDALDKNEREQLEAELAIPGKYNISAKERKEFANLSAELALTPVTYSFQLLKSLGELVNAVGEGAGAINTAMKSITSIGRGIASPRYLGEVRDIFDNKLYDSKEFRNVIGANVPFVKLGNVKLDAFGREIEKYKSESILSGIKYALTRGFYNPPTITELDQFLWENGVGVSVPSNTPSMAYTEDVYREYIVTRGKILITNLTEALKNKEFEGLSPQDVLEVVNIYATNANAEARDITDEKLDKLK